MAHVIPLRPYSYKELTALYGISQRTMKTWLTPFMAEIGEKHSRYFTVRQVRIIFDKLGLPGTITED